MSFFSNLRADRLIAQIKSTNDLMGAETQKAIAKLKEIGAGSIDLIIAALPDADKQATVAFVDVLGTLATQKSFPQYIQALVQGSPRVVAGVAWALTGSRNYPPHLLLEALATPGIAKSALLDVINGQRTRFSVRELLNAAYAQEPNDKAAIFRIIAESADEAALPELISRLQGKDSMARLHIIQVLAKFNKPEVQRALQTQLNDNNKLIRSATLAALAKMDGPIEVAKVCALLRDPEIEVQNRAVDLLQHAKDPDTIRHLVPVLKDESEQARRSAVEVLNEVGDARSVKYLLEAIKDDDWWVRSRAGDALGKIGGPKVIDAVLELVRDKDEDLRRAAIEILNQTKDERAINHLIDATKDNDWWVSERAVDALAEIGSKRAVPRLYEMLRANNVRAMPVVVRAIGKLGDQKSIEVLTPLLARSEKEIRVEAIQSLARLADENSAEQIRAQIQPQTVNPEGTVARAALRALTEIEVRFSSGSAGATDASPAISTHPGRPRGTQPARTLLIPERDVAKVVAQAASSSTPKLDISMLTPGDVIEGRYKYIERLGRGAFGTVMLMEDTVVDERLCLKFLNPNVAQDEEIMKRFVHELRYSRKITHRNVIRIYDFLFIQGLYAISMEYFPSHTLGAEIVNEKPLVLRRALQFGIDIATGMQVAHQVGIVHRDLKPANVLINDDALVKIVDFGVAAAQRETDTQLTRTGYVIGSPKYMAPEQILGRKVDERADIYALGVMMYEMVTGVPPYSRGDHMAVMYQHVQGKARAPQEINPTLNANLAECVVKAMAVDKAKRFQTMEELRSALERFL
jgi:HEAT repeat protein/tRNA A-37 threonylcarbamoyl transferase component Bud32